VIRCPILALLSIGLGLVTSQLGHGEPPAELMGPPLPSGAIGRLGTTRFRISDPWQPPRIPGLPPATTRLDLASLSPGGQFVAVRGNDRTILLVDDDSGRERRRFQLAARDEQGNSRDFIAFDSTGRTIVLQGKDDALYFRDVASGRLRRRLELSGSGPARFAISGDRKILVVEPVHGLLFSMDLATGKHLANFNCLHAPVLGMALSHSGQRLAVWGQAPGKDSADIGRTVQVLDACTAKEIHQLKAQEGPVVGAALTADGKILALVTGDGTVEFWDVGTGKRLRALQGREGIGFRTTFSADGKQFVAASRTGKIQGWDTASGKRLPLHDGPPCQLGSLAFAPGGRLLACGLFRHTLLVWDATTGQVLSTREGHQDAVVAVAFSPNGRHLFSADREGRLLEWDTTTGRLVRQREDDLARHHFCENGEENRGARNMDLEGGGDYVEKRWFAFSPDASRLVATRDERPTVWFTAGLGGEVPAWRLLRLRDRATGEKTFSTGWSDWGPPTIAFSPDSQFLAAALTAEPGEAKSIRIWDTRTAEKRLPLKKVGGSICCLALSAGGKVLAVGRGIEAPAETAETGETAFELRLWDVARGRPVPGVEPFRRLGGFSSAAFSPDGRLLALAEQKFSAEPGSLLGTDDTDTAEETVLLLDAASGRPIHELKAGGDLTQPVLFSPDGRTLVTAATLKNHSGHEIALWETATGKKRQTFHAPEKITALAFSPDGRQLASGHADTTVLLWDVFGHPAAESAEAKRKVSLEELWAELDSANAEQAYRAVRLLARREAVPFLRQRLRPVTAKDPDAEQLARWVADLDSDRFALRQQATESLARAGRPAVPLLRRALNSNPPLEVRRRAEEVLERILRTGVPAELVRPLRAVEALERSGSPQARQLLETLAGGLPEARLTQEAKAALLRLARHPASNP
jgi:WD40 repeat protein